MQNRFWRLSIVFAATIAIIGTLIGLGGDPAYYLIGLGSAAIILGLSAALIWAMSPKA